MCIYIYIDIQYINYININIVTIMIIIVNHGYQSIHTQKKRDCFPIVYGYYMGSIWIIYG